MGKLEACPACGRSLELANRIQKCNFCGYWTVEGTARLDPLVILET